MICPTCQDKSLKVIYAGFPMYLCGNTKCVTVFGFWFWIFEFVPFNGFFFEYDGEYVYALWEWLKGK